VKKGAKHSFALSQNDKKFNKIYFSAARLREMAI